METLHLLQKWDEEWSKIKSVVMHKVFSKRLKSIAVSIAAVLLLSNILMPLSTGCNNETAATNKLEEGMTHPKEDETTTPNKQYPMGEITSGFFGLQGAYDHGLLTVQDLLSIAYYHGTSQGDNSTFTPSKKDPEVLSTEVESAIKEAWADSLRNHPTRPKPNATAADVTITRYYYGQ